MSSDTIKAFIGCSLTCAPFALTLFAWLKLYAARQWPRRAALVALGIVTANAAFGSAEYLYFLLRPQRFVPGWEDPQVLNMGLLFFLAPISMVCGFVAAGRGTPAWLICIVEAASAPLFLVGVMAVSSV